MTWFFYLIYKLCCGKLKVKVTAGFTFIIDLLCNEVRYLIIKILFSQIGQYNQYSLVLPISVYLCGIVFVLKNDKAINSSAKSPRVTK